MIKLIASDMDGTLLNEQGKIPLRFWEIEKKLVQNHILFCAASGRQYSNLEFLFSSIKNNTIFMAENGALVIFQNKILFENPMSKKDLFEWRKIASSLENVMLVFCGKQSAYIEKTDNQAFLTEIRKYYHKLEMVNSLEEIQENMLKLAICDLNGSEKNSYLQYKKFEHEYQVVVSGGIWLDIMSKSTNKGAALEKIKEFFQIQEDELLIFGDYLNDYEMMSCGKYSFAMENAHPKLKEKANYITKSNKEEGVLVTIEKFVK